MAEKKTRAVSRRAPAKKRSSGGKTTKEVKQKSTTTSKVKRVSTKKTATNKQSTKKTTKQAAKKTAKKTTRKSSVKKSSKTSQTTKQSATPAKKTSSKSTTKVSGRDSKDAVSVATDHRIGIEDDTITIFSRVRTDNAVMLVARVLGLLFILLGASSTIFGLGRMFDISGVTALTVAIEEQYLAVDTVETDNTSSDSSVAPVDTSPAVTFDTQVANDDGLVYLLLTVPDAQRVLVSVRSKDTGTFTDLGQAAKLGTGLWKLDWDTTQVHDGSYQVYAYVTNQHGSYENRGANYIEVNNIDEAVTTTETTTNTTSQNEVSTESSDTTDTSSTASKLTISLETDLPSRLSEPTKLEFLIPDASSVQVVLYGADGNKQVLQPVVQNTLSIWSVRVDPEVLSKQTYTITVVAKDRYGVSTTKTVDSFTVIEATAEVDTVVSTEATATSSDTNDEESTDQANASAVETDSYNPPTSEVVIKTSDTLSGLTPVLFKVSDASFAEVYIRQNQSLKDVFLGLGTKVDNNTWRFLWDTTKTPNGEYEIFAKHRSTLGYFYSERVNIKVANEPSTAIQDPSNESYVQAIAETEASIKDPVDEYFKQSKTEDVVSTEEEVKDEVADNATLTLTQEIIEPSPTSPAGIARTLIKDFEGSITEELRTYATTLRSNDEEGQRRSERRLTMIKDEILSTAQTAQFDIPYEELHRAITYEMDELTKQVKQTEVIIKDRIGEAVTKDSDNDGITDYDEVTLYQTDPFSADTDNDGFIDGAEIASGYNPKDASQEAVIAYQSPREVGVVRDDILAVESVTTATPADTAEPGDGASIAPAAAVISGRALPNSFVTIYIFSTPIIVTVKTDAEGGWNYRFDKELEDGQHQVFVGVTDNAGKIVAKSNPFTFIKEAQAFTPVDAEAAGAALVSDDTARPSLLSRDSLVIALGGMIMALGFILLLLSVLLRRPDPSVPAYNANKIIHA